MAEAKLGRPPDYRVAFCKKAHDLAQEGATIREIAEALDVSEKTIWSWRHEHPEFGESLRLGKDAADERVEHALYRRATGYSFDAVKIMPVAGKVEVHPYVEHLPPDPVAAKFWLTNRRSKDWKDRHEVEAGAGLQEFLKALTPD